jgi:hypothetical protein
VRVESLDAVGEAGLPVADREGARLWTDPQATLGLRMEWVAAGDA